MKKKVKIVISTIALGILGSALWEFIIRPLFLFLSGKAIPYIVQFFGDYFYQKIPISIESPSFRTYFFAMVAIALLVLMPPKSFNEIFHQPPKTEKSFIFHFAYKMLVLFIILYNAFTVAVANSIARRTLQNIEIVSPYITDIEYKQLKSDFYLIDSKADYIALSEKLEHLMDSNLTDH